MKRFINCHVPVTTCNLRCPYCYITQNKWWDNKLTEFDYTAEHIKKALTAERLGGLCHFNMCGGGETLLPPQIVDIIRVILENGHSVMVITNGTVSKRFDEIIQFPKELLERLCFKFSFQYVELKRLNLMDKFFDNIKKVRNAGCSFSLELTPHDEIIDEIPKIKEICMKEVGAYCHITVARDDAKKGVPILSKYNKEEYKKIWQSFDSTMFEYKMSTFNIKRKEFCYAGAWSLLLNIGTGEAEQCYKSCIKQNIFKDINKPIKFIPVGNNCRCDHCHNSHAFLTLGLIPELDSPTYAEIRNREDKDGNEWLNEYMKKNLSEKLYDDNKQYSKYQKLKANLRIRVLHKPYTEAKDLVKKIMKNKRNKKDCNNEK